MTGSHNAAGAVAGTKTHAPSAKVEGNVVTDAQLADIRAAARAEGHKEGLLAGQAAERERMGAILGSEEAKGRDDLARHFAFESTTPADAALAALAKAPKADAPKGPAETGNRFDAAMASAGNPKVGLDAPQTGDDGLAFADAYFTAKRQKRSA